MPAHHDRRRTDAPRHDTRSARRRPTRSLPVLFVVTALAAIGIANFGGAAARRTAMPEYHEITFPVQEKVSYVDSYGACRGTNCSRHHIGQDLIGQRLFHLLAATAGTVTYMRTDAGGTGGNWLEIRSPDGWYTMYGHINNDSPGTDDGLNPAAWRFAPGLHVGSVVQAGQFVAYMGDSGDAEYSVPHLHFELHRPDYTPINPWASLRLAQGLPIDTTWCGESRNPRPAPSLASGHGLWVVNSAGVVDALGGATNYGDTHALKLWAPMLGLRRTSTGHGYYLIARDGGVFSYGDAHFYGSTGGIKLFAPIRGITPTPSGHGYWLFADDGGIFSFGDAHFSGSAYGRLQGGTAVGMTPTPSGQGYWIAASNGTVVAIGDATKAPVASAPNGQVDAIVTTPSGNGYWLVTDQGTVSTAGDAQNFGTPAASGLCHPYGSVGIAASATGRGYWIVQPDGTVLAFGDAADFGSSALTSAVVGLDSAR